MGFFNDDKVNALKTGDYICKVCGARMEFEDEWEDVLICPECGFDISLDQYGFDKEEYDELYPKEDELD